jgi:energy-converting hydrogenase Eha subunit F
MTGFGFKVLLALVAAGLGIRVYSNYEKKKAPAASQLVGQVNLRDPLAAVDNDSGPMEGPSTDAITEAAYHQQPIQHSAAFGDTENMDGEEVFNLQ